MPTANQGVLAVWCPATGGGPSLPELRRRVHAVLTRRPSAAVVVMNAATALHKEPTNVPQHEDHRPATHRPARACRESQGGLRALVCPPETCLQRPGEVPPARGVCRAADPAAASADDDLSVYKKVLSGSRAPDFRIHLRELRHRLRRDVTSGRRRVHCRHQLTRPPRKGLWRLL
jgi:hypothetical protein